MRGWVSLLVLVLACGSDKEASLGVPGPIALGARVTVRLHDACAGGGKLSTCGTDDLSELLALTSDDPAVVALEDAATGGPPLDLTRPLAARARAVGRATLRGRGRFRDGTVREATTEVVVRAPNRVSVAHVCGPASTPLRLPCGGRTILTVRLHDGAQLLEGYLPGALITGDDLAETPPVSELDHVASFLWQPKACPATTRLASPFDAKLDFALATYGPADVTAVVGRLLNPPPAFVTRPAEIPLEAKPLVAGQPACAALGTSAHAESPEICTGPAGVVDWSAGPNAYLTFVVLKEGVCRLGLGAAGGPVVGKLAAPIFFVSEKAGDPTIGAGNSCMTPGELWCDGSRRNVIVCKDGSFVVKQACAGAEEICDYTGGTSACRGLRAP